MTKSVEALINPALVVWARRETGLDLETAAKKINVAPERVESWERGDSRPTIVQLRKMAGVYKRPIAAFYLPSPPESLVTPTDYRRLPSDEAELRESPELRYEIRRAATRRAVALELLEEEGVEVESVVVAGNQDESPEVLAAEIRAALRIDLTLQHSWRGPYDSFNGWRSLIEDAGFLVLQMTNVELSEARGFSLGDYPLPVIAVNVKDSPRGRVFSLLHEFAHVAIRRSGLCDLDDTADGQQPGLQIERFCNAAAAATLLPRDALLGEIVVRQHRVDQAEWSDRELAALSQRYGVSREAVLRRLLDLGRTTLAYYRQRRDQFVLEYEEVRRQQDAGFAPPPALALASAGPAFTGLVLSSWAAGSITGSDVSDYLGVRLKHIPKIEALLVGQRRRA